MTTIQKSLVQKYSTNSSIYLYIKSEETKIIHHHFLKTTSLEVIAQEVKMIQFRMQISQKRPKRDVSNFG